MVFLNGQQVEQFHRDGYLIIEDFLDDGQVKSLTESCDRLVQQFDPQEHRCIFSTTDYEQSRDRYFLDSGDKIRYFMEAGAVDGDGRLVVDKQRCLNKIGHALHWLEPAFKSVTFGQKVKDVVKDIGFSDPAVAQSMYIFKQPGIGGEVTPHQDSTFLHTQPMKIVGLWFALEDVTLENGCLWFIPGSHKEGINRRFIRNPDASSPSLTIYTGKDPVYQENQFVAGPVPKGTCVLIDGQVVHKSEKNLSDKSRHIYTFHVIERAATTYSEDNWLQPTKQLPFPGLFDN